MRGALRIGLVVIAVVLLGASVAGANFREKIEELAAELVKGLPAGRSLRIAVADLPDLRGATTDFGRFTAERLATRLAQAGRFTVIERRRLSQVLGELKFSMNDLVDPAKARRLGQMLGVEALVVGSISDLGNQVDVDLRVIEIETNRMMLGASTTITKDQVVSDLMKSGREEAMAPPPAPATGRIGGGGAESAASAKRTMRIPNATLEIVDIRRSGPQMTFAVLVTNQTEKRAAFCFQIGDNYTYFVDGFGTRHSKGAVLPQCFESEPSVPQRVLFRFDGISADATTASLTLHDYQSNSRATERNIPLPR